MEGQGIGSGRFPSQFRYVQRAEVKIIMNDKYERQMKKGVLDMLVLRLLKSEAKYGYQIIQEMREKSGETFLLKDGTLDRKSTRLNSSHP